MNELNKRLNKLETHSASEVYDIVSFDREEKRFVVEQVKIKGAKPQRADIKSFCDILNNPQPPHVLNV